MIDPGIPQRDCGKRSYCGRCPACKAAMFRIGEPMRERMRERVVFLPNRFRDASWDAIHACDPDAARAIADGARVVYTR